MKKLLRMFLAWRIKNLQDKHFIMILSVLIGFSAGIAAVVIKNTVHLIQTLVHSCFSDNHSYFLLATPILGISLTVLFIRYVLRQKVRHGIPNVLHGISKNNGIIAAHNMYSSIVTSALTVGFGGSVGLEGPTVTTGAAIGSNVGKLFRLNYKQVTLLLGCASAGAMASIFKAPIAAIVFALEVIMLDLTMASIVPLLMASASAVLTSYFFLGQDVLYPFKVVDTFKLADFPFYIVLGVFGGFVSIYFFRVYKYIGSFFEKIKTIRQKLLIGGFLLGVLIFFFPSLYGEGYEEVNSALAGKYDYAFGNKIFEPLSDNIWLIIGMILMVVLLKVAASAITFGAGGVGGIFAPSLFMGANFGLATAKLFHAVGFKSVSESNFALIGMAALISGVLHAPLTAIFLIGDLTGGYELFLPLMITATFSYATVKLFEPHSVYTYQLAKRGELITHHKDKAVLSLMQVNNLLETNFKTVAPDATLGDLVEVISGSQRNIFPVIDEENILHGIIFVNDIRHIVFKRDLYESTHVRDLMYMPSPLVHPDELMEAVAAKFQKTSHYNLPVVDNDGKYLGFVSRANVFSQYRKMIKDFSEH